MTPAERPTVKKLRAEIERLGITEQSAGCPIDELIRQARETEDPLAFIAVYGDPEKECGEGEGGAAPGEETPPESFDAAPLPPDAAEPVRELERCAISAPLGWLPIPMEQVRQGKYYLRRTVAIRLTFKQAIALRRLVLGLEARGDLLASGRHIKRDDDAICWLFEQIPLD